MSWMDDYRRHREALLAGTVVSNTPPPVKIGSANIIGGGKPSGMYFDATAMRTARPARYLGAVARSGLDRRPQPEPERYRNHHP